MISNKELPCSSTLVSTVGLLALSAAVLGAEPKDDVQAAVKKLADGANYSWTVTTDSQFAFGATDGKTDKDATTYTVAQFQGSNLVVVQGNKLVLKSDDGTWKNAAKIAKAAADANAAAAGGPGGGFVPESFTNILVQGLRLPTVDMQDVLDKLKELKKTDAVYTAELSPDVAKDLLVNRRPGTPPATAPAGTPAFADPTNPKGSVKFTLKDGQVVKYEVHLSGNFDFGGQDTPIDRTNITEFKDVDTTKVTVPVEAKAKLTAPATATAPASAPAKP